MFMLAACAARDSRFRRRSTAHRTASMPAFYHPRLRRADARIVHRALTSRRD
ncbi:MAG TPA: hypothetical protein VMK05_14865 [Burkholderiales bacterium]|nr:hypothetical protein [Burkholderiales bacterium]